MQGLPPWVQQHLLDDAEFAAGYAAQADWQLAALKTCLARLWVLHPPADGRLSVRRDLLRQGFAVLSRHAPRLWGLLAVDASFASPARLLAGLVPLVTAGIPEILVVRVGEGDWPPALLAALELAGLDAAATLPDADACGELIAALEASVGPGLVLALSPNLSLSADSLPSVWRPRTAGAVAVWAEGDLPWDYRVLSFAQDGCGITVYNAQRVRRGLRRRSGDWPAFLESGADLAAVPETLAEEAASVFPVVLVPGQEAVFAWPDLPRDLCLRQSLAILGAPS